MVPSTFLVSGLLSALVYAFPTTHIHANRGNHADIARHKLDTRGTRTRYTLTDMYQGQKILDEWNFFEGSDPTGGSNFYLNKSAAIANGLAYVQADGTTILAADDTTTLAEGATRNSVRISSNKTYSSGLFVADFWAMPHGCSVWPAYWSVGPDWPANGEIDVIEGVNNQTKNQYTLHALPGCNVDSALVQGKNFTSTVVGTTCAMIGSDDTGCGFEDTSNASFGHGFNEQAGGVFAHLWDENGIQVWRFNRSEIPQDIANQRPRPSGWGIPAAAWGAASCNITQYFKQHVLTLNIAMCGDFAGAVYGQSGCPGTCAQAVMDPTNFQYAKWEINYIAVYNEN